MKCCIIRSNILSSLYTWTSIWSCWITVCLWYGVFMIQSIYDLVMIYLWLYTSNRSDTLSFWHLMYRYVHNTLHRNLGRPIWNWLHTWNVRKKALPRVIYYVNEQCIVISVCTLSMEFWICCTIGVYLFTLEQSQKRLDLV